VRLLPTDIAYIDTRLDEHGLKYQEVYDEIRDHLLLAMETSRANGDERDIELVYNDMMAAQFPGYYPFERIAIDYEKAYRAKIKKMVWKNAGHYLKPLNAIILGLAIVAGYYLPENKTTYAILIAVLLIIAAMPVVYAHTKLANIKTDEGKQSIVKVHIMSSASFFIFLYLGITGVNFFLNDGWSHTAKTGSRPPGANLFMIAFALIYTLSVMRLCRQEIKGLALNTDAAIINKP